MLVSVYLCKNLNRKRAAAGSESAGDAVLPKENAARQAKNAGQKNGCLRKFRKVPERLLQAPGVRESECAEPGRAVVVMPPKEKCGASGKECGAKKRLLEKIPQGAGTFVAGAGVAGKRMRRAGERRRRFF